MERVSTIRDLINALGKPVSNSYDEQRLRSMMHDILRENLSNSEDKRTVQRMTQLLERCIEQQLAGWQPVVQDQNNLALQVDELSHKIEMLSREPVSNPSEGGHMKMELIRLLEDLNNGSRDKEQSGGAHKKFDMETKRHNQSEKFESFQHKDCRPQGPHSEPQYHRGPNQDHSAQNKAFQRGPNHSHMNDQITGSGVQQFPHYEGFQQFPHYGGFQQFPHHGGFQQFPHHGGFQQFPHHGGFQQFPHHGDFQQFPHYGGFQQFPSFGGSTYQGGNQPQPENRQGSQPYGARGGMKMGHQSRGGIQHYGSGFGRASGHNFGSRENINQHLSQQFGNMQVPHDTTGQPRHNSGDQSLHRGSTHQRGQLRGQAWPGRGQAGPGRGQAGPGRAQAWRGRGQAGPGRGQFQGKGNFNPRKDNHNHAQKKDQLKKRNEGDGVEQTSGNTQFNKKKMQKMKRAAPRFNKISNESENKDEDKSDTDSDDDDDDDNEHSDKDSDDSTPYMTPEESENEGEAAYVSPDKDPEDTKVGTATAYTTAVESESEGAAAYVSPSKEAAKSSTDSKPIELLLASEFDIARAKGVNPNQEMKDVVMIAVKQDGIETFHPSTIQEMIDFKLNHKIM